MPHRGEDKGSFRLTARPQDGPKASCLPSHGREIFSLHLSPPSATPPTYGYTSSVGGAVAFLISGYDFLPLTISPPPLLQSLPLPLRRSPYKRVASTGPSAIKVHVFRLRRFRGQCNIEVE